MFVQAVKKTKTFLFSSLGIFVFSILVTFCLVRLGVAEDSAHSEVEKTEISKRNDLDQLVSALENKASREDLIKKIKALQELQGKKEEVHQNALDGIVSYVTQKSITMADSLVSGAPSIEKIPSQFVSFWRKFSSQHLQGALSALIILGLAVLVGFVFEKGLYIIFSDIRKKSTLSGAKSFIGRHAFLLTHLSAHLAPIFVFYATSVSFIYLILIFFRKNSMPQIETVTDELGIAVLYTLLGIFVYRVLMTVCNVLLRVTVNAERYLKISDRKAAHMLVFLRAFFTFLVGGFVITNVLGVLGLENESVILLSRMIALVACIMSVRFIFHYRSDVASWLKAEIEENDAHSKAMSEVLVFIADIWHFLAILSVVAIFITWSMNPESGHVSVIKNVSLTVLVMMAVRFSHFFIIKLIHWVSGIKEMDDKNTLSPMPCLDAFLHWVLHIMALLSLLNIWGVDLLCLSRTAAGRFALSHGFAILVIVLLALIVWEVVNKLIDDALKPMTINGEIQEPSNRLKTFLPIVRNVFRWVVIAFTLLVCMAELGVNITTLLAGIGVIGLAVAMGSQRLAQDIVTGIFILMENSIQMGDVVNVGGLNGEVVAFTIRTIVLRNISGELHTVPYSAIGTVTNLSKDYSNCIMEVSVGHDADIAKVISIFEQTGMEMLSDASFSPRVLSQIKVIGLSKLTDTSANIMSIMKTEPDPYHLVDQEFRRRLKLRFAELDIQVPAVRQVISFQAHGHQSPLKVMIDK